VNEREEIRRKNAADFHDELGHSITRISLFTEMAKREENPGPGLSQYLDKVNENVKYLSGGIRDFIWALDPGKDSVHEVLMRLQEFGDKLFEFTEVKFETKGFSEKFNHVHLGADTRRHVLLIFKEAMNNSLKYAKCTTVELSAEIQDKEITISVSDDGIGFDPETVKRGNGLKNMEHRAAKTGGKITFMKNHPTGSVVRFILSGKF
jgi:signal transduction histidine kinase